MRRFLIISLFILILYSINVSAEPSFNVVEGFVNVTTEAGKTINPSFQVNNTGTTNLNINFTGYTLTKGNDKLTISSLSNITNLANGSTQKQKLSLL